MRCAADAGLLRGLRLGAVKIFACMVAANGIAPGLYWRAERRRAVGRGIVIQ